MAEGEAKELTLADVEKMLTVAELAESTGIRAGVIRREAKKDKIPGCYNIFGRYGFDPEKVTEWVPPEPGSRVGKARADGRKRYVIYLNSDELTALQTDGYEITDPSIAAKARRVERKAKKAAAAAAKAGGEVDVSGEAEEGQDPFKDF